MPKAGGSEATGTQKRCYRLAARPHHGEALKGAEIECTPQIMVFCSCFFVVLLPRLIVFRSAIAFLRLAHRLDSSQQTHFFSMFPTA